MKFDSESAEKDLEKYISSAVPGSVKLLKAIMTHQSMAMVYSAETRMPKTPVEFRGGPDGKVPDEYDLTSSGFQFYPLSDLLPVVGSVHRCSDAVYELNAKLDAECPPEMTHDSAQADLMQRVARFWAASVKTWDGQVVMDWLKLNFMMQTQEAGQSKENLHAISDADVVSLVDELQIHENIVAAYERSTADKAAVEKLKRDQIRDQKKLGKLMEAFDEIFKKDAFCSEAKHKTLLDRVVALEETIAVTDAGLSGYGCLTPNGLWHHPDDAKRTYRNTNTRVNSTVCKPHHHAHPTAPATPRTGHARRLPGRPNYQYTRVFTSSLHTCLPKGEQVPARERVGAERGRT